MRTSIYKQLRKGVFDKKAILFLRESGYLIGTKPTTPAAYRPVKLDRMANAQPAEKKY